jgi:hypothetical protein
MERIRLLWFGKPPDQAQRDLIKEHELHLAVHKEGDTPDFQFARAAVFWATDNYFADAAKCVREFVKAAIDDGVFVAPVVSVAADYQLLHELNKLLDSVDPHGARKAHHQLLTIPVDLHKVLHQFLLHDPGPARKTDLVIEGEVKIEKEEDRFLLQRAFHDCRSIKLEPIAPGYSGADTFIVKATLIDSNAGPEPVPYFAKLGRSDKMQAEWHAFRTFAEHHVEWYLRPNFVTERTTYGVERGILVGTFVQNSCALAEAVRKPGDGARYIRSLFLETLAALRRQKRTIEPGKESVVSALKPFCDPFKVPETRWKQAAEMFGGACIRADDLWYRLIGLPPLDWLSSAIHGDLHGENVRVRKEDSILIDFAHAAPGPACADLAHLEVSLAFDGRPGDLQGDAWKHAVLELYAPDTIVASLAQPTTMMKGSWTRAAVAEIRALVPAAVANPTSPEEYMRVLAVYLLRHASFPANKKDKVDDEYRRIFAFWLACRVTEHLQAMASAQAVPA